jgi:hypothetical protein
MNMDNKIYDDLDKLFQSRLKGDNVVKEDWNKPPQSVFDGAMAELDIKKRKRRKRIALWFLLVIGGTGIGTIAFNTYNRINRLENTIALMQTENEEKRDLQIDESNLHRLSEGTAAVQPTNITTLSAGSKPDYPTSAVNENEKNTVSGPSEYKISSNELIIPDEPASTQHAAEQSAGLTAGSPQPGHTMSNTPWLNSRRSLVQHASLVPAIAPVSETPMGAPSGKTRSGNFSLYGLTGINATTIKMTNTEGADFSLTGYERYYTDLFAGIGLTYPIKPTWGIDLQASYNRMHVQSLFEDEILYNASLETTDDQGKIHYDADYDVMTVIGRQSNHLSLLVNNNQIEDQDKMMNQTTIDNSFRTIGLSLGTFYTPISKERFTLSIGAGAQYNYVLDLQEEMETTIQHNNVLVFRASALVDPTEKANRNYWSWYANLRLGYQVSSRSGIQLDLGTAHSVSSIRKTSGPEDSATYVNNLRMALMMYYRF